MERAHNFGSKKPVFNLTVKIKFQSFFLHKIPGVLHYVFLYKNIISFPLGIVAYNFVSNSVSSLTHYSATPLTRVFPSLHLPLIASASHHSPLLPNKPPLLPLWSVSY